MLLQVLVAREPEVGDAAVCKRTDEWPIVPVEVLVAGFGVAEAFMEVETREFSAVLRSSMSLRLRARDSARDLMLTLSRASQSFS